MKAKITDTCICCGTCAGICPVGAVSMAAAGDKYEVDQNKCIACGACINACPVEAIIEDHSGEKESK
ncbi:MAG: 4Fe-4S binding protein [Bacteroidales bacterium]|nr:4Fe-4S binding protein [Bacteroidales bacterium]